MEEMEEAMKKNYIFLHLLFLFNSIGGIYSKKAGMAQFLSKEFLINYFIVFCFLAIYAVFWQQILKKIPLTVATAHKSVTVIWGLILGFLYFNEQITFPNILGALIIIVGIWIFTGEEKV
jgi:drug/metabolite transporter (DMT)-like permease